MSPSLTEPQPLRLEPPFYLPDALAAVGIKEQAIDVDRFADNATATAMNAALRASIEMVLATEISSP